MSIVVRIEPAPGGLPDVEYRWDTDTDILTANLRAHGVAEGASGLVEVEGSDGSWLVFDVTAGRISGVEVAVWPDVRKRSTLALPEPVEDARVALPAGVAPEVSLEISTALAAEADHAERTIHFSLGGARRERVVRIARDMLLDVDGAGRLAGVWLLNVPPFPDIQ